VTKTQAIQELWRVRADISFQSTNPYNNSRKEKHVRELLADYAARLEPAIKALDARHGSGRGR